MGCELTAELVIFFVLAALAVFGAVSLILQKHPIHSALSLIVVMVALAGLESGVITPEIADKALAMAEVDIEGPDPNALGLLGYDNTPGKDVGNQRLFDRIE